MRPFIRAVRDSAIGAAAAGVALLRRPAAGAGPGGTGPGGAGAASPHRPATSHGGRAARQLRRSRATSNPPRRAGRPARWRCAARPPAGVQGAARPARHAGHRRHRPGHRDAAALVAKLDGFLTGASTRARPRIALDYVRRNADVFGLTRREVRLTLRKDYVDIAGTHHLSFVQTVDGVPVFGNGLKAHVAKNGRLIQVDGSPRRRTCRPASAAPS